MANRKSSNDAKVPGDADGEPRATVEWDDSKMTSGFANVVNIQSTRDQVDVFFGINQTWNLSGGSNVKVELTNRVILTPLVAKRMWLSLGDLLKEHEKRHGELEA